MSILTLSRQMGSLGDEVAETLASKLGWELITRNELLPRFLGLRLDSNELRMLTESAKYYLHTDSSGRTYKELLETALHEYARSESAILVGFGSQSIFAGHPDALHVRIAASRVVRLNRMRKQYHLSVKDAEQIIETADRKHRKFVFYGFRH